MNFDKLQETIDIFFIFIIIISLIVVHFTVGIDTFIFESVPTTIAKHNEEWYTKREVKNYTPKQELESILKNYKENPSLEFSKNEINKLTHTMYNGIWCSSVEDNENSYTIVLSYQSSASFWEAIFPSDNFSKYGKYEVDKTSFEIIEILYENFVGGQDYEK